MDDGGGNIGEDDRIDDLIGGGGRINSRKLFSRMKVSKKN